MNQQIQSTLLDLWAETYNDPVAVSFTADAGQARAERRTADAARLLYAAADIEWGSADWRTGEAYRRAVVAGGIPADPDMIEAHGFVETLCLEHHRPLCRPCRDEYGSVTCHDRDHEDNQCAVDHQ